LSDAAGWALDALNHRLRIEGGRHGSDSAKCTRLLSKIECARWRQTATDKDQTSYAEEMRREMGGLFDLESLGSGASDTGA
jgi:hypothetical protein